MAGTDELEMQTDADEQIESLIGALGDDDWEVRRDAAESLGEIGDLRAIEPLIDALRNDRHRYVRSSTIRALGRIGDPKAVEPLIDLSNEHLKLRHRILRVVWNG